MYHHLEAIRIAVSGCFCRGLSAEEEGVKEHLVGTGEGRTSDLLKYSWGFLHFNLLLFKRWLFPRQTAPGGGKRFPAPWQSWTSLGWKPLRAPGLLVTDAVLQAR